MSSITGVSAADTPGPDDDLHEGGPEGRTPAGDGASTGRLGDKIFGGLAGGAGLIVVLLVALVGAFLVIQAVPSLLDNESNFLFSQDWDVDSSPLHFGIARLLWVTVLSSVLAMCIAVPLSVCIALFLTQYAPKWLAKPGAALIDLLAAVPSIVYGLWGVFTIGPHFQPVQDALTSVLGWFPLFSDEGASAARTIAFVSVILAIMILPIITALSREVFAQTPQAHKDAATALGATNWEVIRTAVLPFGKPGVISASMLGLGRALGETVAVMMIVSSLADGAPWSWSMFTGGETFASKIANNAGEFDDPGKTGAFIAAGLVLFILTFIVNAIARIVIERRKAFTE
jgi:phosphate transport system permease protein